VKLETHLIESVQ